MVDEEKSSDDLQILMQNAYSYNSRDKHRKEHLPTHYAGTVKVENRLYDLYVDTGGNAWYIVRIITERGPLSEFEAIFGYPQKKQRKPKKKW